LQQTRQNTKTIEKYADEIVAITDRLVALEIKQSKITEEQEINAIKKVFGTQALGIFKKGLRREYQTAVCAAMPIPTGAKTKKNAHVPHRRQQF
jgi:hypothetical protein